MADRKSGKNPGPSRPYFGLAVVTGLLATACVASRPVIAPPEVRLESVEVTKLGIYGQTVLLGFAVSNPNPFPLPVKGVRYEVTLDDRRFAGGESRGDFIVGAEDAGEFAISVEIDLLQSAAGVNHLIESGPDRTMRYELEGSLGVDIPGALPVRFAHAGFVSLGTHTR